MLRAVLDSNAIDPIANVAGASEAIESAIRERRLELLVTHVTVDELAKIPNAALRSRLEQAAQGVSRQVPTGAFILGFSRLDEARLVDDSDVAAIEALRSGNTRHSPDALIASTARFENCALVTNERRLTARAREQGIQVLSSAELFAAIGFVPGNAGAPTTS